MKHLPWLLKLAFPLMLTLSSFAQATFISLESEQSKVFVGEDITLKLWVRDLAPDYITAFSLDLAFADALVSFKQASSFFSNKLGDGIDSQQDFFLTGASLNIAELSFLDDDVIQQQQSNLLGETQDFQLASLVFSADAVGIADFIIGFEAFFGGLVGADGLDVSFDLPSQATQVEIIARNNVDVPSPSAFWLSLGACLAMYMERRMRSRLSGGRINAHL